MRKNDTSTMSSFRLIALATVGVICGLFMLQRSDVFAFEEPSWDGGLHISSISAAPDRTRIEITFSRDLTHECGRQVWFYGRDAHESVLHMARFAMRNNRRVNVLYRSGQNCRGTSLSIQ